MEEVSKTILNIFYISCVNFFSDKVDIDGSGQHLQSRVVAGWSRAGRAGPSGGKAPVGRVGPPSPPIPVRWLRHQYEVKPATVSEKSLMDRRI